MGSGTTFYARKASVNRYRLTSKRICLGVHSTDGCFVYEREFVIYDLSNLDGPRLGLMACARKSMYLLLPPAPT